MQALLVCTYLLMFRSVWYYIPQVYTYCMLDDCTLQLASADLVCAIYISFVFGGGSLAVCPVLLVLPAIDHLSKCTVFSFGGFPQICIGNNLFVRTDDIEIVSFIV